MDDAFREYSETSDEEKQKVLIRYASFLSYSEMTELRRQSKLRGCGECLGRGTVQTQDQVGKWQKNTCPRCHGKKKVKRIVFTPELDSAYERIINGPAKDL